MCAFLQVCVLLSVAITHVITCAMQSAAEHVEQLAHRLLHRSPSSPPISTGAFSGTSPDTTCDASTTSTSTGAYQGRRARSTDDTAKSQVRRSLLWERKGQLAHVAEGLSPSQSPGSSSIGTAGTSPNAQDNTAQSKARSGRSSSDSGLSPAASSGSAIAAKRLAVLQAYAQQATSRKRHAGSSGGGTAAAEVPGCSSGSVSTFAPDGTLGASHMPSGSRGAAPATAPQPSSGRRDAAHDAEAAPEEVPEQLVVAGEASDVRVYKYPRATRHAEDDDSDADSVPEEPELQAKSQQQQQHSNLEFTFGSVLQASEVSDEDEQGEFSGSEHGSPARAAAASHGTVGQSTPGSEWSSSPGMQDAESPLSASELGSGLSRTLDVSLGGHATAEAAIHAALGGASAGHYSMSFGPCKQGGQSSSGSAGAAAVGQPVAAGGSSSGSTRPPLPPGSSARRSTWDNSALTVSPGRVLGQLGTVASEDSVLFGSPVHKDSYQTAMQHPLAPGPGPQHAAAAEPPAEELAEDVRASFKAEPHVVLYEPSRYQESPEVQPLGSSLLEQHVAAARAAALMRLSSSSSMSGSKPAPAAAPATTASVPLPQMPTPTTWKAGMASPMAKVAAAMQGVTASSVLPFSPTGSPGAGTAVGTPYAAPSTLSIPPTPATDLSVSMPFAAAVLGMAHPGSSPAAATAAVPAPAVAPTPQIGTHRSLHAAMDAAHSPAAEPVAAISQPEAAQPPSPAGVSAQTHEEQLVEEGVQTEAQLGAWGEAGAWGQQGVARSDAAGSGSVWEPRVPASRIPWAPGVSAPPEDHAPDHMPPTVPAVPAAQEAAASVGASALAGSSPGQASLAKLSQLKLRRQQQWQHSLDQKQPHDTSAPGTAQASKAPVCHESQEQPPSRHHSPTKHRGHAGSPRASGSPSRHAHAQTRRMTSPTHPPAHPPRRSSRDHGNVFSPLTLELRASSLSGGAGGPSSKARHLSHALDAAPNNAYGAAAPAVQHSMMSVSGLPSQVAGSQPPPQLPGGELGHGVTGLSTSFAPGLLTAGALAAGQGSTDEGVSGRWVWHPNVHTPEAGSSIGYSPASPASFEPGSGSPPRRRRTAGVHGEVACSHGLLNGGLRQG